MLRHQRKGVDLPFADDHLDAAGRRELHGVADQVEEDLFETVLVLENLLFAEVAVQVELQLDAFQVALDLKDLLHVAEDLLQLEPLLVERKLPQLQFRQVEDVLDRLQKELARSARHVQHLLRLKVHRIIDLRVYCHHRVDGRAQVVGHRGEVDRLVNSFIYFSLIFCFSS